jgi:hypothetical protein
LQNTSSIVRRYLLDIGGVRRFLLGVPAQYALDFVNVFLYFLFAAFEHVDESHREAIPLHLPIVLILLDADFQERRVHRLPSEE